MWSDEGKKEARISFGMQQPGIRDAADYVFEFLDEDVPRIKILRNLAFAWDSAATQLWVSRATGNC
jgi:hypothetical protein